MDRGATLDAPPHAGTPSLAGRKVATGPARRGRTPPQRVKTDLLATPKTRHQTPRTKAQEKCAHFPFWVNLLWRSPSKREALPMREKSHIFNMPMMSKLGSFWRFGYPSILRIKSKIRLQPTTLVPRPLGDSPPKLASGRRGSIAPPHLPELPAPSPARRRGQPAVGSAR